MSQDEIDRQDQPDRLRFVTPAEAFGRVYSTCRVLPVFRADDVKCSADFYLDNRDHVVPSRGGLSLRDRVGRPGLESHLEQPPDWNDNRRNIRLNGRSFRRTFVYRLRSPPPFPWAMVADGWDITIDANHFSLRPSESVAPTLGEFIDGVDDLRFANFPALDALEWEPVCIMVYKYTNMRSASDEFGFDEPDVGFCAEALRYVFECAPDTPESMEAARLLGLFASERGIDFLALINRLEARGRATLWVALHVFLSDSPKCVEEDLDRIIQNLAREL
jgi:hypothetical protein